MHDFDQITQVDLPADQQNFLNLGIPSLRIQAHSPFFF